MFTIIKRELLYYFYTSTAYAFLGIFISLAGLLYSLLNLIPLSSDIPGFLSQLNVVCLFLLPILTMNSFSKEFKQGTNKLLFSAPIPKHGIVLGKFFAAFNIVIIALFSTFIFVIFTKYYGEIYWAETLLAYLGIILNCILFLSLDLFIASICKNQIAAAIASFASNLFLWFIDLLPKNNVLSTQFLSFISPYHRLTPFMIGQLSYANIVYFIVFSIILVHACTLYLQYLLLGGAKHA